MKYVPERTCICCRKKFPKKELIRIVRNNDEITVDKTGKLDGRGAYFCGGDDCKKKLVKTRALNRSFKREVDNSVYENIIKILDELNDN